MNQNNNGENKVVLGIGVNGIDELKSAQKEVKKLGSELEDVGKKEASAGQVKNLKTQLREATQEAQRLAQAGQQNTEEYRKALTTIAELRDLQDELNRSVTSFDNGNRYKAFAQFAKSGGEAINGLVGATELLGFSSDTAEQAIKKMLAIQNIVAAVDAFGDINDVVKAYILRLQGATAATEGATVATNGFNLAFKAIGIGLLITSIGLLVANFDKVKEAVFKVIPGLKSVGEFFVKITQSVTDFVGITSQATRELEKLTKATTKQNEAVDNSIKLLEAQGGKESQIFELKKKRINSELNLLREKLKVEGKLSEEEQKQFRDSKLNLAVLEAQEKKRLDDKAKKDAEDAKKRAAEALKKRQEAEFAARKDLKKVGGVDATVSGGIDVLKDSLSLETALRYNQETLNTEIYQRGVEARIALAEREKEVKVAQINEVSDTLDAAASIFSENTIAFKSLASANALINAYTAINEILAAKSTLPEPFGSVAKAISAAAIGANAFKQVKSINGVQVKGKSGGGSSVSAPSVSAPIINSTILQKNNNGTNDVVNAVNSKNDTPIRAYIVDKDLQKQSAKQDYFKQQSTI